MTIEELLCKSLFVYKLNDDLYCIGQRDNSGIKICCKCYAPYYQEVLMNYNKYLDCLSKIDKDKLSSKQLDTDKDSALKELIDSFKGVNHSARRVVDSMEFDRKPLDSALAELSNPKIQNEIEPKLNKQKDDFIAVWQYCHHGGRF